ncbi:MAG: 30S ribosomal protein S16 [Candidatus Latescibacterota bacterium]
MVKLRLSRLGKKKQPFYRIVAMDVSSGRQGLSLGEVGTYDPLHATIRVDEESALLWLNRGAEMTGTVAALLRSQGVLARWKGREGRAREDALTRPKPARRRKLAATAPAPESAEAKAESEA